jgi:hypothetical protein
MNASKTRTNRMNLPSLKGRNTSGSVGLKAVSPSGSQVTVEGQEKSLINLKNVKLTADE